jgi:3',5'-cyclic-AMP phosphodiesterase
MQRRNFLQSTFAASASVLLPNNELPNEPQDEPQDEPQVSGIQTLERTRVLRIAYLTDVHVKPGLVPEQGMAKAFQSANTLQPRPDFVINGGDAIMDALEVDKPGTQAQWDVWSRILKSENSLPIHHCIGNHDVWGWFSKNDALKQDKLYGKQWAVDMLAMPHRYYSFDQANWHFIVLDSTQLNPAGGYIGKIDDEQMEWLRQDLAHLNATQATTNKNVHKHICVISHIPILSMCAGLFWGKSETNGDHLLKRNLMHTDFFTLKNLFATQPSVRLCLSGHIHLQDEVQYLGVKYWCNGAVSGGWWKGKFQEFEPAYAVIDLYSDGSSERTLVNY